MPSEQSAFRECVVCGYFWTEHPTGLCARCGGRPVIRWRNHNPDLDSLSFGWPEPRPLFRERDPELIARGVSEHAERVLATTSVPAGYAVLDIWRPTGTEE